VHTWSYKRLPGLRIGAGLADNLIGRLPGRVQARARRLAGLHTREFCNDVFNGDWTRHFAFQEAFKAVNDTMRGVLDELFRGYAFTKTSIIWRLAETRVENLHFDIDRDSNTTEAIRLYMNVDDAPRIWHTTHGLSELVRRYYRELDLARFSTGPCERLVKELSIRLFGGWQFRGREQFPRHNILFEPMDVWLVDGRRVPHQVAFGRRVVSTFFLAEQNGLPPHHRSFGEQVRDLHAQMQRAPDPDKYTGARQDGSIVPYPPAFPAGGAPSVVPEANTNLKDNWDEIYSRSVQQKIVRL
jgi:hypothetical protein